MKYVTQYIINDPNNDGAMKIFAKLAKQLGWVDWSEDDKVAANKVLDKLTELAKQVGFPLSLKDTGISEDDFENNIESLVNLCYQDASSVLTPRPTGGDEFKRLFRYAYEGKDIDF